MKNCCVLLAPSMAAASYMDGSMDCRPVIKNSILIPKFCQMDASIRTIMAVVPLENHFTGVPPRALMAALMTPWSWPNR